MPGLSQFGLSAIAADADPSLQASNPQKQLITWNGVPFTNPVQLIHLSEVGDVVSAIPGIGNRDSPLAPLAGDVLYIGGGGFLKIHRVAEDGTDALYIDADADILAGPGYPIEVVHLKDMRVDNTGRLYLFLTGDNLYVYRWLADTTFDQMFTLAFDLNGIDPASHDGPPQGSPNIGAGAGLPWGLLGADISPDGRYVYAVGIRHDTSTDLSTAGYGSNMTIYKFDLTSGPTPTGVAWAAYPFQIGTGSTPPHFNAGPYDFFISAPIGISVSPDGLTVAVEVKTMDRRTQAFSVGMPVITTDYNHLKNWIDLRDAASGALISHTFLADDFLDGDGGPSPFYYACAFSFASSGTVQTSPMVWAPDSTVVYFWLVQPRALDSLGFGGSARVANYTCLFRSEALLKYNVWDASYAFGSVSSFANWTPYMIFSGQSFPGEGRRTAADSAGGTFQFGPALP